MPAWDSWELEERLRHIERLLRIDPGSGQTHRPAGKHQFVRIDAAHSQTGQWHYPQVAKAKAARGDNTHASPGRWLPALTWAILALGLMVFTCGGVLLAWSSATGRQDLWAVGMPVGVGGQIVLLLGLILQLDRLWHDSRRTAQRLSQVDEQLHELNTTATLLGAHAGTGSGSFYAHLAGGASPQLLLADLKSQLDLLAVKLAQAER